MHTLKNGAPAHELTLEDRRKAAAVTNQIRREKRELLEMERLNEWIRAENERAARRRAKRRARYLATGR